MFHVPLLQNEVVFYRLFIYMVIINRFVVMLSNVSLYSMDGNTFSIIGFY